MGHINRGDTQRTQQAIQFAAQPIAQRGVERRQRLVEQQDARPDRDRARQCDALTLPAGKLVYAAVLKSGDIGQRHQFGDACRPLLGRYPADLQTITDIVRYGHVGEKRVGLEHHADVAPLDRHRRHVLAVE